jgi:hypothetical protein
MLFKAKAVRSAESSHFLKKRKTESPKKNQHGKMKNVAGSF